MIVWCSQKLCLRQFFQTAVWMLCPLGSTELLGHDMEQPVKLIQITKKPHKKFSKSYWQLSTAERISFAQKAKKQAVHKMPKSTASITWYDNPVCYGSTTCGDYQLQGFPAFHLTLSHTAASKCPKPQRVWSCWAFPKTGNGPLENVQLPEVYYDSFSVWERPYSRASFTDDSVNSLLFGTNSAQDSEVWSREKNINSAQVSHPRKLVANRWSGRYDGSIHPDWSSSASCRSDYVLKAHLASVY